MAAQRVCFPVIFQRPDLRDVLEQLQPIPRPVPQPDRTDPARSRRRFEPDLVRREIDLGAFAGPATGQVDLRTSALRTALTDALGDRLAKRVIALSEPQSFADDVPDLATPAFGRDLRPPLPADLRAALLDDDHKAKIPGSVKQLAAKLNIEVKDLAGLDLRRAIGPFRRCVTVFLPEWTPILDVPDITFRVSQDTNGDGIEEPIYSESYFQVRWNSGSISDITIEADPNALAGRLCRTRRRHPVRRRARGRHGRPAAGGGRARSVRPGRRRRAAHQPPASRGVLQRPDRAEAAGRRTADRGAVDVRLHRHRPDRDALPADVRIQCR